MFYVVILCIINMESEFKMREELEATDFVFNRTTLYEKINESDDDYNKKWFLFDCNIGSFCCEATKENIIKIMEIAKKYGHEGIFLFKACRKDELDDFEKKTVEELKEKNKKLFLNSEKFDHRFPVMLTWMRSYNYYGNKNDLIEVKDFLSQKIKN